MLAVVLGIFALWCAADWYFAMPPDAVASYVGRESCIRCHEDQFHSWQGSDHDRAMEVASEETVLGDFDDVTHSHFGTEARFFRRDGRFFVHTEGPDGEYDDFEIKYTFGIDPLQQYMVEFADGRVQVLREAWDTVRNQWFYVTPPDVTDERIEPGDPLHWTGLSQNWNTMCADCHSTNLEKNFHLADNKYHTTYSEINVSCEACHGPGSLHVELAESRSLFWDRHHGTGLTSLKKMNAAEQVETCAPCHSRRTMIHEGFQPGDSYYDHYEPTLLHEGLYHADGQILDEVYVYGSYLQSRMYAEGVKCTDCHISHSFKLKFEGNRLCAQCHEPAKYDTPSHHHHTDLEATKCVTCHMPTETYMVIDDRRDHSIRVPRPDLTVTLGTPNVCNDCHTNPEETPEWATGKVREWYGDKRPDDPHFAPAIAAGREGSPEGLDLIRKLLRRPKTPDIVRATAIDLLSNYANAESDRLCREFIHHRSPLVRATALRNLSDEIVEHHVSEIAASLQDPVRLVRLAAARRLVGHAAALAHSEHQESLERAVEEYRSAQEVVSDRAGSHINLAALNQALGDDRAAIESLRTAIRLEPYLSGVREELSKLLDQMGGDPEEIRELRLEEIALLERDSELLPTSSHPHYRRGMLLYLMEKHDEARKAFEAACQLAPNSFDNWLALVLLCEKQERWEQAVEGLKKMHEIRPGDPAIGGILRRMQETVLAQEQAKAADDATE